MASIFFFKSDFFQSVEQKKEYMDQSWGINFTDKVFDYLGRDESPCTL